MAAISVHHIIEMDIMPEEGIVTREDFLLTKAELNLARSEALLLKAELLANKEKRGFFTRLKEFFC